MNQHETIETSDKYLGFTDHELAQYLSIEEAELSELRQKPFDLSEWQIDRLETMDEIAKIFRYMVNRESVIVVMRERPIRFLGNVTYVDFMTDPNNDPTDALNAVRIGTGYSDVTDHSMRRLYGNMSV